MELGLALVYLVVTTVAFYLIAWAIASLLGGDSEQVFSEDLSQPLPYFIALGALGILILPTLIAARHGGRRPAGFLWSVAGRIRWSLIWKCLPLVVAFFVAQEVLFQGFQVAFYGASWADMFSGFRYTPAAGWIMLWAVLLTPLQAGWEELFFRGMLPQIVGSWVANPWIAYGLSVPLFVAGHTYNWVGLIDIAVFAICMSYLTYRTRGIEAGLVIHVVGNIQVGIFGALSVWDPNIVEVPPSQVIVSSTGTIVLTWLVLRLLRPELSATTPPVAGVPRVSMPTGALVPSPSAQKPPLPGRQPDHLSPSHRNAPTASGSTLA